MFPGARSRIREGKRCFFEKKSAFFGGPDSTGKAWMPAFAGMTFGGGGLRAWRGFRSPVARGSGREDVLKVGGGGGFGG